MIDQPRTEEALRIFWQGNEVSGLIAYGYWPSAAQPKVPFPSAVWPAGASYQDRWMRNWKEGQEEWRILVRDVMLPTWPEPFQWCDSVKATLQAFLDSGVCVAWCGIEGHFVEPPALFDPAEMAGGVWAALGPEFGYECTAELGRPWRALPETDLMRLKEEL